MKDSPKDQKLREMLASDQLVHGGFLGKDDRPVEEIIEADEAELVRLGYDRVQVAGRMSELTELAAPRLGGPVELAGLEVVVDDYKGSLVCPWGHPGRYPKRLTTVRHKGTGETVRYSDLNTHLIAEHGFFEGRGTMFRQEPGQLVRVLFEIGSERKGYGK